MKIFKNLKSLKKLSKTVIAIGNFDGLHLGHKKVLDQAYLKAKKNNLQFGVVTFEPVPAMFFNKKIKNHRINNLNQKIQGFKKAKLDFLLIINFNKKFSNLNYFEFIKKIVSKKLNTRYIFISKNFKFGKNREGNVRKLISNETYFSYKTIVAKPLKKKKKTLSSSIIRNEISKGNIQLVNRFLGRNWCVEGKVEKGNRRGRKIGFRTCNIDMKNYIIPKLGVYSIIAHVNKIRCKGIANVGYRPTFNGKKLLLEAHLFGVKENLYNKTIKVKFIKFIRHEKKFKSIVQLKKQIKKDIIEAKK